MTEISIRNYKPNDLEECRKLWEVLTQRHRDIYDDQTIGGEDPGKFFDEHLELVGPDLIWLAEMDGTVVGMIILMKGPDDGWEVEPIVIKPEFRGQGIGRRLIEHVIEEARTRDIKFLSVKPVFRNAEAITIFHKLGFDKVGCIELFMQLDDKKRTWKPGARFNDLDFEY